MRLTFGQVEDLIAILHDVADEHRIALRGRIKHFQRNGWPRGTNTGKGKPACYDFPSLLGLTIAFEFTQIGISPDRVVEVLDGNWSKVTAAASLVLGRKDRDDPLNFIYLYCDPAALSTLSQPSLQRRADLTFQFFFGRQLVQAFQRREPDARRIALVNLSDLLEGLWNALNEIPDVPRIARDEAYQLWAISLE